MKNSIKFFGIIALTAVIGLMVISCGDDDEAKVTLSGTLSVSLSSDSVHYEKTNNGIVPIIEIFFHDVWWTTEESIKIISPGSNTGWSVELPAQSSAKVFYFRIYGYESENDYAAKNALFNFTCGLEVVGKANISEIQINFEDLKLVTLSGTIKNEAGNIVPAVAIQFFEMSCYDYINGWWDYCGYHCDVPYDDNEHTTLVIGEIIFLEDVGTEPKNWSVTVPAIGFYLNRVFVVLSENKDNFWDAYAYFNNFLDIEWEDFDLTGLNHSNRDITDSISNIKIDFFDYYYW